MAGENKVKTSLFFIHVHVYLSLSLSLGHLVGIRVRGIRAITIGLAVAVLVRRQPFVLLLVSGPDCGHSWLVAVLIHTCLGDQTQHTGAHLGVSPSLRSREDSFNIPFVAEVARRLPESSVVQRELIFRELIFWSYYSKLFICSTLNLI